VTTRVLAAGFVLMALVAPPSGAAGAQAISDDQIKTEVRRELSRFDRAASKLTVDVHQGVVMLSGDAPTLWIKAESIRRALKVNGVKSLEAQVTVPKAENDAALTKEVIDRVRHYDLYTVYDNIQGRIRNGAVVLEGQVTEPKKSDDLAERVEKIKGVQSLDNRLEVLPASQSDNRLRVAIANAIYRDQSFENYSMVDPPVHVIVNNGHVTLIGFVRNPIEKIKAESIARSAFGVLALENKIELVGPGTH
jgi:osmotically-inducible protein OsmY